MEMGLDWIAELLGAGAQTALGYSNLAYQIKKDSSLTGAEREANRFSAQQAEIARDWQERMYTQYESPQAMIRQAQEAGINPAAIFGNSMGGSMPSASSPTSTTPKGGDVGGAVAQLASLAKQIAEIDLIKSETKESESRININAKELEVMDAEIKKIVADEESIRKQIEVMNADISVKEADAALKAAQTVFQQAAASEMTAEAAYKAWKVRVAEFAGFDPTTSNRAYGPMARFVLNFLSKAGGSDAMDEAVKTWREITQFALDPEPQKPLKLNVE